ncbi:MAG: MarR family transcriptional regulator [Ruminococcus sp.]|nr:MarR family transcriptional regulator [Ruminococcus sp.]
MATREEALQIMERMQNSRPRNFFRRFDDDNAGIFCVLKYLSAVDRPVSAGEISAFMNVSTARVSVILRKMAEKGYILRESDVEDARKSMISLSDFGREKNLRNRNETLDFFCKVIDRVGRERIEEFISISDEIRKVVEEEMQSERR